MSLRPPASTSIRMRVAPASSEFSRSSLTTEAGRSTTSPAAIWFATRSESTWMRPMERQWPVVGGQWSVSQMTTTLVKRRQVSYCQSMREISRRNFLWQAACLTASAALPHLEAIAARGSSQSRLAADKLRPQFHLLPAANWMNDPNGPIFYRRALPHVFSVQPQWCRSGDTMHWAHATSPDMIHWQHEPVAIAPTPNGWDRDGVFSGSIVLDGYDADSDLYRSTAARVACGSHARRRRTTNGARCSAWRWRRTRACALGRN